MDVKKKLVELLTDDYCPLLYMQGNVDNLADYLIKSGVTVQEVEVPVRCRECEFYVDAPKYAIRSNSNPNAKICRHPELDFDTECADHWIWMEPEDFCSRGVKKQT